MKTIGTIKRVKEGIITLEEATLPQVPCIVQIGTAQFEAIGSRILHGRPQLVLIGIGVGTIGIGQEVKVSEDVATYPVREFYGLVTTIDALRAIQKPKRPHGIKCQFNQIIYQYFDGVSSGDVKPDDSDGTGIGYGNGWWINVGA